MRSPSKTAPRGRPPSITQARIAEAGAALTLPKLSFTGVAAALGVSHIALYKHVENLAALKELVADGIFAGWQMPPVLTENASIEQALLDFHHSLRVLVLRNPGLAPYLVKQGSKTAGMLERIQQHHRAFAAAHGISVQRAGWLLNTVAFHCVALADTVYLTDEAALAAPEVAAAEVAFERGMLALIRGAVSEGAGDLR